jgi:fumarylpyruvate hydrolase
MYDVTAPSILTEDGQRLGVRRIFCIGKNYADHVAEMGSDPKTTPPVFFTKPADAACQDERIAFPKATGDLHYEGELVALLGMGGSDLSEEEARAAVIGHACGCDLTRRDLQAEARERRAPWDLAKALDNGAMLGRFRLQPALPAEARLSLAVNGETRQSAPLSDMIWRVPELIAKLSGYFELRAGDLVFTGTPAGVGPLKPGDDVTVEIADLPPLRFSLSP